MRTAGFLTENQPLSKHDAIQELLALADPSFGEEAATVLRYPNGPKHFGDAKSQGMCLPRYTELFTQQPQPARPQTNRPAGGTPQPVPSKPPIVVIEKAPPKKVKICILPGTTGKGKPLAEQRGEGILPARDRGSVVDPMPSDPAPARGDLWEAELTSDQYGKQTYRLVRLMRHNSSKLRLHALAFTIMKPRSTTDTTDALSASAFPSPLSIWQRAWRIALFTLSSRWLEIVVPAGIFLLLFLAWKGQWYGTPIGSGFKEWEWLKDPVDVTTLVIASVVLLAGLGARWRESLPRTVTVYFVRPGCAAGATTRPLSGLACQVPLMADADVRAWAQQVGQQVFEKQYLKFIPMLVHAEAMVVSSDKGTELWKGVFIFLTEEPCAEPETTRVWERAQLEAGAPHRKEAGLKAEMTIRGWGPFKQEYWTLGKA